LHARAFVCLAPSPRPRQHQRMPHHGRRDDVSRLHPRGGGRGPNDRGGPYNARRWRRRRRYQLRAHPLCELCEAEGRAVLADIVHHVEPHDGNVTSFWFGTLQSLCRSHHERIHGRDHRVEIGVDGWPVKQATETVLCQSASATSANVSGAPSTTTKTTTSISSTRFGASIRDKSA